MPFKPLKVGIKPDALKKTESEEAQQSMKYQSHKEIVETTTERIRIIYDDSGSMYGEKIILAGEATEDFLKNCTPHVTAVEVDPLNEEMIHLTKNLPALAKRVKEIQDSGGTPLYQHLEKLIKDQPENKFTHAVVFTDGYPDSYTNSSFEDYEESLKNLIRRLKALEIPIDIILIGNIDIKAMKDIADATGGYYLVCKDGKVFKEKLKYFAPTLRWMLPQIASKGN